VAKTDPFDGLKKPYPVCVVTPETWQCLAGNDDDEDYVPGLESCEEEFDEEENAPSED
jgi:hypothetical protein